MSAAFMATMLWILIAIILLQHCRCEGCLILKGSKMSPGSEPWVSRNGVFALGFLPRNNSAEYWLSIWFAQTPGDPTVIWVANSVAAVGPNATLLFETSGNLRLKNAGNTTVWQTQTGNSGAKFAILTRSGNLVLVNSKRGVLWESFCYPTDALVLGQSLTEGTHLATLPNAHGAYYTLRMIPGYYSVRLALSYVRTNSSNITFWWGPAITDHGCKVSARLLPCGSLIMADGTGQSAATYVYHSEDPLDPAVLRLLKLDADGRLHISHFDAAVNAWVSDWSAESNRCAVAGICGVGICSLSVGLNSTKCICPQGYSPTRNGECEEAMAIEARCRTGDRAFTMERIEQTNYFIGESAISNHSNVTGGEECGELCMADCGCVASVYGMAEEASYCWTLRRLEFGGFPDAMAEMYVKVRRDSATAGSSERRRRGGVKRWLWIFPVAICTVLPFSLPLYLWLKGRIEGEGPSDQEGRCFLLPGLPIRFSFDELQKASTDFSELLGNGGFGRVYRGSLPDGTQVAVKKLDEQVSHRQKEFEAEVVTIGAMNHTNLVRLRGFCSEGQNRLLVYEFMENGSLDKWLFPSVANKERLLVWKTRFDIAVSTASGIAYCHEQCRDRIIHCDIKPGNVLLDENFQAKVSDFGLAKLVAGGESQSAAPTVRGTRGYLAPEWIKNRPITVKVDVYSYGILLLELIGGRRNRSLPSDAEDFFYPKWAYEQMMDGTPEAAADPRLDGNVDPDELMRCLQVAFWCLQEDANSRPSMGEVVKMLEGVVDINTPPLSKSILYVMVDDGEFSANLYRPYGATPATLSVSTLASR